LIFGKIVKIVATRCHILKLKCTKFDFGWGFARPSWGTYSAPPDPLARLKRATSNGREREGREGRAKEGRREGRGHTLKASGRREERGGDG